LQSVRQDIRYALRAWNQNRIPTLAAFLALALGIGATTAIFSVVNGVLLHPLPVQHPDRIVRIFESETRQQRDSASMPDILDWKKTLPAFEAVALYRSGLANMTEAGKPVLVTTLQCDAELFRVLGVNAARGRAFTAADNIPGQNQAIMLSWAFWQRQFGGQPVLGKTLRLDGMPHVIAGILPENLNILGHKDAWVPVSFDLTAADNKRGVHSYAVLGRLRPGVTLAQANAALAQAATDLAIAYPAQNQGVGASAITLRESLSGDLKKTLLLLLAAVTCVLLIACANVANLSLARASARRREFSVRLALGAGRRRLFQQLMTESLMLASCATAAGVALAAAAIHIVKKLDSIPIPRPEDITLDWRVLLFAIGLTVCCSLLFGLLPALQASAFNVANTLKQTSGSITESKRQQWVRRFLVIAETAVATLLLIESVLLIKSFAKASGVDPGFEPSHVMTLYASLPSVHYGSDTDVGARFANRVLERLRTVPGIESAAFIGDLPFASTLHGGPVSIKGKVTPKDLWKAPFAQRTAVTSDFSRVLKIPILKGRPFSPSDDVPYAKAVLVNETFARQFFPGENPLGQQISYLTSHTDWHEIVGVIGDTRQQSVEKAVIPQFYVPLYRSAELWPALVVRTAGSPSNYAKAMQKQLQQVDPEVPVFLARTMEQILAEQLGWRAFHTSLLAVFAGVALTLSSIGIYAVISYSVTQRTSEIGVRMACGAGKENILRMIVLQGMLPALLGTAIGAFAALGVAKIFSQLLYGIRFTDYVAYFAAMAFLVAIAAAASYVPARRAAAVNPWRALRHE
jgi:putative ABC transport system permease protein